MQKYGWQRTLSRVFNVKRSLCLDVSTEWEIECSCGLCNPCFRLFISEVSSLKAPVKAPSVYYHTISCQTSSSSLDMSLLTTRRIRQPRRPVLVRRHVNRGIGNEEIRRANHKLEDFHGPVIVSLVSPPLHGKCGVSYMTGQSSTRGLCVMPNEFQITTSVSSTASPRRTASATPSISVWLCRV